MDHFTMKLLSLKENPNTDYVILQLHGGGYTGELCAMRIMCLQDYITS